MKRIIALFLGLMPTDGHGGVRRRKHRAGDGDNTSSGCRFCGADTNGGMANLHRF